MNMKSNFRVLKGGLAESPSIGNKEFKSAYVTDTRLMGVLSVGITWTLDGSGSDREFHQFFYMDVEEYGLENYKYVLGTDMDHYEDVQREMIGGLGARTVEISLREAMWLLQKYARIALTRGYKLPDGQSDYEFLLSPKIILSDPEMYILDNKQCKSVSTPYEAINYFVMRGFAKDFDAAAVLSTSPRVVDIFPDMPAGTLCKNTIEEIPDTNKFLCESLVEAKDHYYIAVTEIQMDRLNISGCEKISSFDVTFEEAALALRRDEYVEVYDIDLTQVNVTARSTFLLNKSTTHTEVAGRLFVLYKPDNEHVNTADYRLNDDYYGIYFFTSSAQLITMANSIAEIKLLNQDLIHSPLGEHITLVDQFLFNEPIIYDFIQSGLSDFVSYVDVIRHNDEE